MAPVRCTSHPQGWQWSLSSRSSPCVLIVGLECHRYGYPAPPSSISCSAPSSSCLFSAHPLNILTGPVGNYTCEYPVCRTCELTVPLRLLNRAAWSPPGFAIFIHMVQSIAPTTWRMFRNRLITCWTPAPLGKIMKSFFRRIETGRLFYLVLSIKNRRYLPVCHFLNNSVSFCW